MNPTIGRPGAVKTAMLDASTVRSDTEVDSGADFSPSALEGDPMTASPSPLSDSGRAQLEQQEALAHASAKEPPGAHPVPGSRYEKSFALVKAWAAKQEEAGRAGVNLHKTTFFPKLLSTGAALFSLAIAATLTVMTAGAAAPLLVIAGVRALTVIGDCACAWEDRKRALHDPPLKPLPMGANCIGNLFHSYFTSRGDPNATRNATLASLGITVLMAAGGLALGFPHAAGELFTTIPRVSAELSSVLGTVGMVAPTVKSVRANRAIDKAADAAMREMLLQSKAEANENREAQASEDDKPSAPEFSAFCAQVKAEFAQLGGTGARHKEVQAALDTLLHSARPELATATHVMPRTDSAHLVGPAAAFKAVGDLGRGIDSVAHTGMAAWAAGAMSLILKL